MISLDLRTGLLANAALATALATRAYPGKLPQTVTLPAATYDLAANPPGLVYRGRSSKQKARVHWDCHAPTLAAAGALAEKVATAARSLSGTFGSSKIECVNVLDIFAVDLPDTVPGLALHRVRVDMSVWYKEV